MYAFVPVAVCFCCLFDFSIGQSIAANLRCVFVLFLYKMFQVGNEVGVLCLLLDLFLLLDGAKFVINKQTVVFSYLIVV